MKLLLLALLFGVPEDPTYTSSLCIHSWSDYQDAIGYEVQVGTSSGVYDLTTQSPGTLSAITCEDMQITIQPTNVQYFVKVNVLLANNERNDTAYIEHSFTITSSGEIIPGSPQMN